MRIECPDSWDFHQNACYYYGHHTSYNEAESKCEGEDARLVDMGPRNTAYVKKKVKDYGGGNDFWIGTYFNRGKLVRKKGTTACPVVRGQPTSSGPFASVDCNPSYRYICQKYGDKPKVGMANSKPGGSSSNTFEFGGEGESEVPLSTSARPTTTTAAEASSNSSQVIPAVVSVVVLLVAALVLRYLCKRRTAQRLKKKKMELKQDQEKKASMSRLGSTMTGMSRTTSVNKAFELPSAIGLSRATSTVSRTQKSSLNNSGRRSMMPEEDDVIDYKQSRGRHRSRQSESEYHRRYKNRSLSVERNLHGVHSPTPPYERRRRGHSTSRSRSVSRRRAPSEYTESSRSSSEDSRLSDSAISSVTEATFRRSGHRRSRNYDRGYSRSTNTNRHRADDHYDRDRHDNHRHQPRARTMYDRYAAAPPPMSAHEVLSLTRDRNYRGYAPEPGFDYRRHQSSKEHHYFPQMTNVLAWSDEDLPRAEGEGLNYSRAPKQPQARFPRQAPIRVNRHIHDSHNSPQRKTSEQSEHIYESLDEVARQESKGNLQRDASSRASARSRSSMIGRKLPAVPKS